MSGAGESSPLVIQQVQANVIQFHPIQKVPATLSSTGRGHYLQYLQLRLMSLACVCNMRVHILILSALSRLCLRTRCLSRMLGGHGSQVCLSEISLIA